MERPGNMITDAVEQYLRQADLFTYVGGDRDFFEHRPDYVLSGSVKAIEQLRQRRPVGGPSRYDAGAGEAGRRPRYMAGRFRRGETGVLPAMKYTVAALSGILAQQMKKAIEAIDFKFRNKQRPALVATDEKSLQRLEIRCCKPKPLTTSSYREN